MSWAQDGEPLAWQAHGSAAAPTLHLFHGLISSRAHWPLFTEHFARDWQLLDWDYRGHGGQPLPRELASINVGQFAEDSHVVLHAAGKPPAVLVALSFGVQVALEHYRRYPNDARALVLMCGTAGHPLDRLTRASWVRSLARRVALGLGQGELIGQGTRALWKRLPAPLLREAAYWTGGARREYCPPEVLDAVFSHAKALDPRVVGHVAASYFEHSADDVLPSVRVPTLIIAGDRDELTPVAAAERMRDRIPGAELVVFPGHSHLVLVEKPAEVHALIERFLARL